MTNLLLIAGKLVHRTIAATIIFAFLQIISNDSKLFAQNKDDFKPNWEFGGTVFLDYFYKINGDTIYSGTADYAKTEKDFQAFSFRRVIFGARYNFTENISANTAIEANDGLTFTSGDRLFFVKFANAEFRKIFKYSKLLAGLSATPTYSINAEPVWGYRSIEKTITDMRGLGASTDLGVLLTGNFSKDEMFGYSMMVGNGRGTKIASNKGKKFYGSLFGRFAGKKLITEIYSDYFFEPTDKSKITLKGFVGYSDESFAAGVEVIKQQQMNYYKDTADISPFGVSVFASAVLTKGKLKAFARYDFFENDTDFEQGRSYAIQNYFKENFITAGIDYMPIKQLHIMPNIWINTYTDKRTTGAVERKPDVVGRVTMAYFLVP